MPVDCPECGQELDKSLYGVYRCRRCRKTCHSVLAHLGWAIGAMLVMCQAAALSH